ncbi:hypothetical protein LAZ67_20000754 [Cordylochernes scorpioides]|uniref:Uncharacterized protein n=1 Tax=Cordylochernes scorpioides TaxID=51811 RepID=A0ABY6LMA0_9ARAC|nr:hypothetical protein LAZ67_20000754 [Cordylochernes scorpioides]
MAHLDTDVDGGQQGRLQLHVIHTEHLDDLALFYGKDILLLVEEGSPLLKGHFGSETRCCPLREFVPKSQVHYKERRSCYTSDSVLRGFTEYAKMEQEKKCSESGGKIKKRASPRSYT